MKLGGGHFVHRLAAEEQRALRSHAARRVLSKGEKLFLHGDVASDVFIIVAGHVKLTVASHDGRQVLVEVRGYGDLIGELALLGDGTRSASAFALTSPTEFLVVSRRSFEELMLADPAMNRALLEDLAEKLRMSAFRQLELAVDDVSGRVVRRLIELAERFGEVAEDGTATLRSPITQQDIADWAGVSRQAVVKELRTLRDAGAIETQGSRFTLIDRNVLDERVERLGAPSSL